jgi:hypothetical protein
VPVVRESVAYAEITNTPLCILSIDFKEAFDDISHTYFFELLREYGFGECIGRFMKTPRQQFG